MTSTAPGTPAQTGATTAPSTPAALRAIADWLESHPAAQVSTIALHSGQPVTVSHYASSYADVDAHTRRIDDDADWAARSHDGRRGFATPYYEKETPIAGGVVYRVTRYALSARDEDEAA